MSDPSKILDPLLFGHDEKGAALIQTEEGIVRIQGRDISRLYFVLSQAMDDADRQIVLSDLKTRGVV